MDLFASLHSVYEAGFLSKLMTRVVFVQASAACYKCAARMGKMSNWLHVVGH